MIYDKVSANNDSFQRAPADVIHMFWSCPSLVNFWVEIFKTLSEVVKEKMEPNHFSALFRVPPTLSPLIKFEKDILSSCTLLARKARRLIVLRWKSPAPPCHTRWIKDVLHFLHLEKIRLSLMGCFLNFRQLWDPFLHFKTTNLKIPFDGF